MRDRCGERVQHFGRKILAFIDDHVAIATFPVVGFEFLDHTTRKFAPVVGFAAPSALIQVARIQVEQNGAFGSWNTSRHTTDTFCGNVVLFVFDAVLLDPLELFVEKFYRTLQNLASYFIDLIFFQCETNEEAPVVGSAYASPWQFAPGREVTSCEAMIIFYNYWSFNDPGQIFHIGDQASIERHQQSRSTMVRGRIGQIERPENGQRRLAAAGGAEHHGIAVGGEVQYLPLSADWPG